MFGIWAVSHAQFVISRHLEQIPAGWNPSPVDCESWILNDHHVSSCMLLWLVYDTVKLYIVLSEKIISVNGSTFITAQNRLLVLVSSK